jgi:hypothetical protein
MREFRDHNIVCRRIPLQPVSEWRVMWTFTGPNCTLSSMKRHWLQGRTKPGRNIGSVVLLALVLFASLVSVPIAGLSQAVGGSHSAAPSTSPANPGASSASQATKPQSAPNATPVPYRRFVAVLCSGLIISTARLARKFRMFWGLGVFTNLSAVLFVIFGVVICALPVMAEGILKALPVLGSLGPWIADLSGIVIALVFPSIGFKRKAPPAGEDPVRDLADVSSSNPIVALFEESIRDCIIQRMQKEVVADCRRYDWSAIKLAAGRALEEEMTVRALPDETYARWHQLIENFQADPDPRLDSSNKYKALVGILKWCSFKRLRSSLNAAATETGS